MNPRARPFLALMGFLPLLAAAPVWSQSAGADAATTAPAAVPTAVPTAVPAANPTVAVSPTANADSGQAAAVASAPSVSEAKQMTCRTVKITGSNLRTRKVCSTPNSQQNSSDWVRDQQDRGAIGASAVINGGGG
jgi:hypothetical protein